MAPKVGNTVLTAMILTLACSLRAGGWEEFAPPHAFLATQEVPVETQGPVFFAGILDAVAEAPTFAVYQEPLEGLHHGRQFELLQWQSMAPDESLGEDHGIERLANLSFPAHPFRAEPSRGAANFALPAMPAPPVAPAPPVPAPSVVPAPAPSAVPPLPLSPSPPPPSLLSAPSLPSWPSITPISPDDDEALVAEPAVPTYAAPSAADDYAMLSPGRSSNPPDTVFRLGWWSVVFEGSPTKVGEYQDLDQASFFDVDLLRSDGYRTVDLFATGLDDGAVQAGLDYFDPRFEAELDFEQYLHRRDHDPLENMGDLASGEEIVREDLNVGEDYAIRVEELKTSFKGKLGKNVKVRLNFRIMRKQGDRQANAVQHCSGGIPQAPGPLPNNTCHMLSQRQRIDWVTAKFEPVIEGKFGPVNAEYSRPMRIFDQNDQVVTREFGLHTPTDQPYAVVPNNFTQVDRLKLGVNLPADTRFYARLQTGDTHNRTRQAHRKFHGYDLRLTNRSWDGVTLTGYATWNEQRGEFPSPLLAEEQAALAVLTSTVPPYGIRHPINYSRRTVGAEAAWRPFRERATQPGLGFTLGCEQGVLERDYAAYVIQDLANPPGLTLDQERTTYVEFHYGCSLRWSPNLETFVRYRLRSTKDPLFAVNRYYGYTNTNLPELESLAEIGGTWTLGMGFLATASIGFQDRQHHSEIADFEEDNYPMTFTLWYAPTIDWSLSAGYGYYSNWIDQEITFPSDTPNVSAGDSRRFSYGGRGRVLSAGGSYAWTRQLTLSAGVQFVWAHDAIDPLAAWPDLPQYFDVIVNRTRITGGFDWSPRDRISVYLRYVYEDYEDLSVDFNSGTTHMFLTGISAVY